MEIENKIVITDLEEYQKCLFLMLIFFDDFCKKNDIEYSLLDGTLLGAVREGSFIPWDDDVDVCVSRKNLEKLKTAFQRYDGRYDLNYIPKKAYKRNGIRDFLTVHCKLIDKKCSSQRYSIDIFTVDYLGNDLKTAKKIVKKSKTLFSLSSFGPSFHWAPVKKGNSVLKNVRNIVFNIFFPLLFLFHIPFNFFYKKSFLSHEAKIQQFDEDSKYYTIEPFLGRFGISSDNILNGGYCLKSFNGLEFLVFKKYDIYLRRTYGDYMIPPPKKERVPYHSIMGKKGISITVDEELQEHIKRLEHLS